MVKSKLQLLSLTDPKSSLHLVLKASSKDIFSGYSPDITTMISDHVD